jgi:hypothetical protein
VRVHVCEVIQLVKCQPVTQEAVCCLETVLFGGQHAFERTAHIDGDKAVPSNLVWRDRLL